MGPVGQGCPQRGSPEHPAAQGAGCLSSAGGRPGLRDALRLGLSGRMREPPLVCVLPRECELPPALPAAGPGPGRLGVPAGMRPVAVLETLPLCGHPPKARVGAVAQPRGTGRGSYPRTHPPPSEDAEGVPSGTFPSPTPLAGALPARRPDVCGRTYVAAAGGPASQPLTGAGFTCRGLSSSQKIPICSLSPLFPARWQTVTVCWTDGLCS